MDAPALTPDGSRELAALRQRAYGPDADIQRDPEAMRRLDELEALARLPVGAPPAEAMAVRGESVEPRRAPPADPADPAHPVATVADPAMKPVGAPEEAPGPHGALARRPWWRGRRLWIVAAVSLVLGLVIGAVAAWVWVPRSADAPDQTLSVVGDSTDLSVGWIGNLTSWGVKPSSVTKYQAFDTVDVWVGQTALGSTCLLLSHRGRIFTTSCAAKGLDPVLDLTVDNSVPVQWNRAMPTGTVVRFVARSDGVDVWVRHPPSGGSTTN